VSDPDSRLADDPVSALTGYPLSELPDYPARGAAFGASQAPAGSRWWLVLERAQAALPLLAVAGLAGFTWWLVQSSPKEGQAARAAQASSAPDYELKQARVARFDAQGRLQALLDGQAMRHFPATDTLHIEQVVLSARDDKGVGVHAVANEGEADQRTEVLTLRGGARVVAYPPLAAAPDQGSGLRGGPVHFAGEGLRIDTRSREVSSSLPVLLTQAHSQIQAQSMHYSDQTGLTDLGGRVHGRYEAAAAPSRPRAAP
jgi:lipopolysaccharide export system protein LptC